jgi:hypothetical protein
MKPSTPLEIRLFDALKRIARDFMTPDQIRRDAEKECDGPGYEEYLEMSYENIQETAKRAVHGVRIKRP